MDAWNQIHSFWNFLQILDIFFANFSNTFLFNRLFKIVGKDHIIACEILVSCSEWMLGIKFILFETLFRLLLANFLTIQPFNWSYLSFWAFFIKSVCKPSRHIFSLCHWLNKCMVEISSYRRTLIWRCYERNSLLLFVYFFFVFGGPGTLKYHTINGIYVNRLFYNFSP